MARTGLLCALALSVCSLTATATSAQVTAPSLATMRDASADLANFYLRVWSSSDQAALADVQRVYAPRVNFYGRVIDKQKITAEKMRFVRRWPIRRYSLRPGTTRVDCDRTKHTCVVRTLINWQATSPQRSTVSRGVSEFKLGIAFSGPQPLVVYEGGRVLSRGRAS